MATPVNHKVSPAFDSETYNSVEGVNDDTRGYISDVLSWANDAYDVLGKLHKARELADQNPGWTPEQRTMFVAAEANKQQDRLARRLDRTVRDLDSRIATTHAELLKPIAQAAAAGPLAAEVRAYAKSASGEQRAKIINEALDAGDEATVQALLGVPPFLSGMTPQDRDYHLERYHAKKSPQLVARRDVMVRVRELLNNSGANGPAFRKAFSDVIGAKPHAVRALQEANQRAVDALNIGPAA